MSDNAPKVVYRIDAHDALVYADDTLEPYAAGVPALTPRAVGRQLWTLIADDELRAVYVALVARARKGHPARFYARCDSQSIAIEIAGCPAGEVEFRVRLSGARLQPAAVPSTRELLRLCAWCHRADRGGWREIEEVVAEGMLERATVPRVTHGICDACLAATSAALDRAA